MTEIVSSLRDFFWPQEDLSGKPVYLQETGEKLGEVSDVKTDEKGKIVIYTVDCEGAELDLSSENILKGKQGLIYRPVWLTEAENIVKKLEAQQRLNPDIASHTSETLSRSRIRQILSRGSSELERIFEEAKDIASFLNQKKQDLEQKRDSLSAEIERLAQKRMRGEGSRKDFAESIVNLKRKAKIVEENLNKVESLYKRLKDSPLIDMDRIKESDEMPIQNDERAKGNPNPSSNQDISHERKLDEGERIKKVRIPKLEQQFGQKEEELQKAYVKDLQERIKQVNQDIKDLRELANEHEEDEKVTDFIDKKVDNLKEEKKDLRNKIKEVKSNEKPVENADNTENLQNVEETTEIEGVLEETEKTAENNSMGKTKSGIDGATIARLGSLAVIIGLIVLLVLSLLQVF